MSEKFGDIVAEVLKGSGASKETLQLWQEIGKWYEEGGPEAVEERITEKIKEIEAEAKKITKRLKKEVPTVKKKRKRKRRRR